MIKFLLLIALALLFWLPVSLIWLGVKRTLLVNQYLLFGLCVALIVIALLSLFLPRPERYDIPPFALWAVFFGAFAVYVICFQIGILVHQYFNHQDMIKSTVYFLMLQIAITLLGVWISTHDYSFVTHSKAQLDKSPLYTPNESELTKRYFLSSSDLHKQKSDKPTYLYEEISEQEALQNQNKRAYYIGYYQNDTLIRYEKKYRGETLMQKKVK